MQHHHPGSWYLPWGVPLQKMLVTIPHHHHPQAGAAVYHHHQTAADGSAAGQTQMASSATFPQLSAAAVAPGQVMSSVASQQHQHQQQQQQSQSPQTNHLSAHRQGHYQTGPPPPSHYAMHHHHPHHPQMHPHAAAAAAAMFTPISLRSFLGHQTHNMNAALSQAQPPANSPLGNAAMPVGQMPTMSLNVGVIPMQAGGNGGRHNGGGSMVGGGQTMGGLPSPGCGIGLSQHSSPSAAGAGLLMPMKKTLLMGGGCGGDKEKPKVPVSEKRKSDEGEQMKDLKKAKLETKALKAKRPGFTDERYHETSYYIENGLRKVYPYYFTFTTFTKGRWVGEKILDVFAREFRAHPAEEYERCIDAGKLTVNYEKVATDYRLKHNDLLANIVHRHEVPVTSQPISIVHMDDDIVVVNKPASIPVHPCGRYRHNTVVFILAKEYNLKNLRTIHRLDRLTSGLLLFGRSPKKARQMEHQIRNRQVQKEYVCRVEGEFPDGVIECKEPIEVVSYKIGVCKVSSTGKDCTTTFQKIGFNGYSSVVLCKPLTGRMHQIRVHLQYLGYPVINDPLYNHEVFGPSKGKGGDIGGKTDEQLVKDLINIHNAENWLGIDGDSDLSLFKPLNPDDAMGLAKADDKNGGRGGSSTGNGSTVSDDESESVSRETSPCSESPQLADNETPPPSSNQQCPDTTTTVTTGTSTEMTSNSSKINSLLSPAAEVSTDFVDDQSLPPQIGIMGHLNENNSLAHQLNMRIMKSKMTVSTQTGQESPDTVFTTEKISVDKHCYECKVRYRDPKPQDLVMYLHAWKYKGIGWEYETELPEWSQMEWMDSSVTGSKATTAMDTTILESTAATTTTETATKTGVDCATATTD